MAQEGQHEVDVWQGTRTTECFKLVSDRSIHSSNVTLWIEELSYRCSRVAVTTVSGLTGLVNLAVGDKVKFTERDGETPALTFERRENDYKIVFYWTPQVGKSKKIPPEKPYVRGIGLLNGEDTVPVQDLHDWVTDTII